MARSEQVIDLLLKGCANQEIAEELKIKVRTVKAHLKRLFAKHNITAGGIKRVKLAVVLYRLSRAQERSENETN